MRPRNSHCCWTTTTVVQPIEKLHDNGTKPLLWGENFGHRNLPIIKNIQEIDFTSFLHYPHGRNTVVCHLQQQELPSGYGCEAFQNHLQFHKMPS
jgi:hypothetical protein